MNTKVFERFLIPIALVSVVGVLLSSFMNDKSIITITNKNITVKNTADTNDSIEIVVYDCYGATVHNAKVQVLYDSNSVIPIISRSDGRFSFDINNETGSLKISVSCPAYDTQIRILALPLKADEIVFHLGVIGSNYLYWGEGEVFPYTSMSGIIGVLLNPRKDSSGIHNFLDSLGLVIDYSEFKPKTSHPPLINHRLVMTSSLLIVRKKDGTDFPKTDCYQMDMLRKDKRVLNAGPFMKVSSYLEETSLMSGNFTVISKCSLDSVRLICKEYSLTILSSNRNAYLLTSPGLGEGVNGLVLQLIKNRACIEDASIELISFPHNN